MKMFTQDDRKVFNEKGITINDISEQLSLFQNGFPYLPIVRPATAGDGILVPRRETLDDYVHLYNSTAGKEKVLKFVPASGAATRMFKDLYGFIEDPVSGNYDQGNIKAFLEGLPRFAFYGKLAGLMQCRGVDIESITNPHDYVPVIKALLLPDGLDYGNLPKGLVLFHKYEDGARTAFEEHLVEGAMYCRGGNNIARIHLTISDSHIGAFGKLFDRVKEKYEKNHAISYETAFSTQKPSTDTIAVTPDNKPFRDSDGKLVFRPGGHGALLNNLNELDADIIFIKNIDNVVPDNLKEETIRYKKALGGMLISFRERIFDYLNLLNNNDNNTNRGLLEEILTFLKEELSVVTPWGADQWTDGELRRYLAVKLNRPLRICGMVKNVGEPGGGPFWVRNNDESIALQILESSQINLSNPLMKKLFDASTHFNPVDLVCSIKDYRGNRFNLRKYRDPETGFISHKSSGGRELKALELPGLWNGAMSDWNTVFVEVPLSTFNPVKTVNDLLRPEHVNG